MEDPDRMGAPTVVVVVVADGDLEAVEVEAEVEVGVALQEVDTVLEDEHLWDPLSQEGLRIPTTKTAARPHGTPLHEHPMPTWMLLQEERRRHGMFRRVHPIHINRVVMVGGLRRGMLVREHRILTVLLAVEEVHGVVRHPAGLLVVVVAGKHQVGKQGLVPTRPL